MELLWPTSPQRPAADRSAGAGSPITIGSALASQFPGIGDVSEERVYVAVGKSPEKTAALLQWTFRHFGCKEVGLLHVHQPSPTIPTLLGRLPASQANEHLVSQYRRVARENTKRALLTVLTICYRAQVQGKIVMSETGLISDGILDLVAKHRIHKLVMGETPDNCFQVKGRSSLTTYIAKKAPPFCEIWFVAKGQVVWTREPSEETSSQSLEFPPDATVIVERFTSRPLQNHNSEGILFQGIRHSSSTNPELLATRNMVPDESRNFEMVLLPTVSYSTRHIDSRNSTSSASTSSRTSSVLTSPADGRSSSLYSSQELETRGKSNLIKQYLLEAERSKTEVFTELATRKKLESGIVEAYKKTRATEEAHERETKLRKDLEDSLIAAKMQQEDLVRQRNETTTELEHAMRNIMSLNQYAQEVVQKRDEAMKEFKLIHASIAAMQMERQKIQWQREKATEMLERWRCNNRPQVPRCIRTFGFVVDDSDFTQFSLSDLQTVTCDFSESFKLGGGGYSSFYKGEIFSRTVVIKKLHRHDIYAQSEFQREVNVLSRLRHPHLVTLIGMCPEALSLVYEYLPNGTLHDHLFRRTAITPLPWRVRCGIAAKISSALLFLHSSKPEKVIHGDLKSKSIFLDYDFNCKIGNFGVCHLVPENEKSCALLCWNGKHQGLFYHAEPEYQKADELAPMCDVYCFGIIVLQLLTGKSSLGLASEVRRVMSAGKFSSVLDPTAGEWPITVATTLAEFALRCTERNGPDHPEFTPILVKDLEELHTMEERPVPQLFLCPILQEVMQDPQVAADGFTYEARGIQGWFQNGGGTSPMTNLKLDHLNLTPNHALRFAIQDWLCKP